MNCLPTTYTSNLRIYTLVVFFGFFSFLNITLAQTNNSEASGASLSYSPPIIELTLDPGESFTDIIKVENSGNITETFYPSLYDFLPAGENGGQEFIPAEDSNPTYSLSKWVTFPSEPLVLRPKEGNARQYTITVPTDALPGGRYAALFFDTKAPESSGTTGARLQTRTGPIVLVTVTGEVKENLRSVEFAPDKSFYEYAPVGLVSRIENDGTIHTKPIGQITIKNMFGKVVDNLPVNETLSNILPNSTRRFDLNWEPTGKFLIGKYTAVLNLTYGSEVKKNVIDVVTFWIIPWKLIVIALLSLTILFFLLKLGFKKYNTWVLQKSTTNGPDGPVTSSIASEDPVPTTSTIADVTEPVQNEVPNDENNKVDSIS